MIKLKYYSPLKPRYFPQSIQQYLPKIRIKNRRNNSTKRPCPRLSTAHKPQKKQGRYPMKVKIINFGKEIPQEGSIITKYSIPNGLASYRLVTQNKSPDHLDNEFFRLNSISPPTSRPRTSFGQSFSKQKHQTPEPRNKYKDPFYF